MPTLSDAEVLSTLAAARDTAIRVGYSLFLPAPAWIAALDAAIERFTPPQGELGEAVERLESAVLMAESPVGATVTTRDVRAEDIRRVLAEVRSRQEPEADPPAEWELDEWRPYSDDVLDYVLTTMEKSREVEAQQERTIRRVLEERTPNAE